MFNITFILFNRIFDINSMLDAQSAHDRPALQYAAAVRRYTCDEVNEKHDEKLIASTSDFRWIYFYLCTAFIVGSFVYQCIDMRKWFHFDSVPSKSRIAFSYLFLIFWIAMKNKLEIGDWFQCIPMLNCRFLWASNKHCELDCLRKVQSRRERILRLVDPSLLLNVFT